MSTPKPIIGSTLDYALLKQRHRLVRNEHPTSLTLRIHRALSWLNRAEQAEDVDGKFIFLWIAFNAAYAQELDDSGRTSDKVTFTVFLQKLYELDASKSIDGLIWKEFSGVSERCSIIPMYFICSGNFSAVESMRTNGRIGSRTRRSLRNPRWPAATHPCCSRSCSIDSTRYAIN